jgi:hypothetical protein
MAELQEQRCLAKYFAQPRCNGATERHVHVDRTLCRAHIRTREICLDDVGACLGGPLGATRKITGHLLGCWLLTRSRYYRNDQDLPFGQRILREPHVCTPNLWGHGRHPETDGRTDVSWIFRGLLDYVDWPLEISIIVHQHPIWWRVARTMRRTHRFVRENIPTASRVAIDPLAVQKQAGWDP